MMDNEGLIVVYDITILSNGFRFHPSRTGIHRVVERTARGLDARHDISLKVAAAESWENYYWAGLYLRDTPGMQHLQRVPNGLLAHSLDVAQEYLYAGRGVGERGSKRVARRLVGAIANRTSPLPARTLSGVDIFHSGFYSLPEVTRDISGVRRFITIYDMIPVLFPQFFAGGFAIQVRDIFLKALASIRDTDFVLAISQSTKSDLCSHLPIDPARVFVTPLAAATEQFYHCDNEDRVRAVKRRYAVPDDAQYMLSVNTLEPRKNMERAVKSFARVVQQHRIRDLYFVLVGTRGWDFDYILRTIADCNLASDRIIVTGYVPDDDLAPLYSGAAAFIYPSEYEGFGLPPLEAMQCGTPVITSNTSSLPEVVGDAGIMVSPTDEDALSQAILDLYQTPALRAELAVRSHVRSRDFSWERYTNDVVNAYREALNA